MRRIYLFFAAIVFLSAISACSKKEDANINTTQPANENKSTDNSTTTGNTPPALKPGEIPFAGFPTVNTTAKASEFVLCPSYNWIQDAVTKGSDKVTFIFYSQKMVTPGDVESEVEFLSPGKKTVPNAYIIAIPAGQSVKNGDIVLTWWQSGSGMQRAIVTDASNPKEPVVRYLDLDYDNPAKSRDGKTTIGQMDEKLKPDTFYKLTSMMEPGTAVAAKDGSSHKHVQVVRVAGGKVLTIGFAGKMKVYDRADCTAIPLVPGVNVGDTVKVPYVGSFTDATVTKVDSKIGRVFVTIKSTNKEAAIAFGDVVKSL